MSVDYHLLAWAAFALGCGIYLYQLAASRRRAKFWEPIVVVLLFLVILFGPIKFNGPSESSDRQARTLEYEMQQRTSQTLPERVTQAPRLSFQELIETEKAEAAAHNEALRNSITKEP